ncbi:MAG: hypothetical protein O9302_04630 [Cyclobacteriaceae bacterium]|jgi:hypothetical protein|nr:hypothetical protein [Cytophagales bacterium]MCZ8327320.1 hypothetical protein [Cyclobacteriaceae bacterium]
MAEITFVVADSNTILANFDITIADNKKHNTLYRNLITAIYITIAKIKHTPCSS